MQTVQNVPAVVQNGSVEVPAQCDLQNPIPSNDNKTSRVWTSAMWSLPKNAFSNLKKIQMLPAILFDLCKKIYECAIALLRIKKEKGSESPPDVILTDDQILCASFQGIFDRFADLTADEIRERIREQPDKLKEITYFNRENLNLNRLPPEILKCPNINNISLSTNKFKEIPSEVYSFSSTLLDFNISDNEIQTVPPKIEVFEKLDTLDISRNAIKKLPQEIGNLTRLTVLHAEVNKLEELPDVFYTLKNLSKLYVEENELKSLPPSIGKAASLTEINCTGNKIAEIPAAINEIKTLMSINLSCNKIRELVPLNGCRELNYLNVSNNELKRVPPKLFEGLNLVTISLAHNQIEDLPELNEDCTHPVIMTLDISYNAFRTCPKTLSSLNNLRLLILDEKQIKAWQSELTLLKNKNHQLVVREPPI